MKLFIFIPVIVAAMLQTACSASRPVLYPNGHLSTVGMEMADRDIAGCMEMARNSGADGSKVSTTTKQTTKGAVIGGTTGAAVGAVLGNPGQSAASGAVGGATGSLTYNLLNSDRPAPVYEDFVNRCLYEKGYDVVGWR